MAIRTAHWPALFNDSGRGDARFSPILDGSSPVPTAYFAATDTVALLETAMHHIGVGIGATDTRRHLGPWSLVRVVVPSDLRLLDLRNEGLSRLGIARHQNSATSAQHYPCTREWATALRGRKVGGQPTHGIIWDSRIAEVAGGASPVLADVHAEVCVLFGDDLPTDAVSWAADVRYDDLTKGPGLMHAEEIVTLLGGTLA